MAFNKPSHKSINLLATFVNNENSLKMPFGPSLYNYQLFNICDLDMMVIQLFFSFGILSSKYPFLNIL